jgi:hypothetical protein
MTLQYGHLQMNRQFVEDDDGNDAFIQYGICTNSIQTIVSLILEKIYLNESKIKNIYIYIFIIDRRSPWLAMASVK